MAYWGMSMANQSNKKRAKEFIEEAVELIEKAGPRRKALDRGAGEVPRG